MKTRPTSTVSNAIANIADENAGTIVLTQGANIASAAYAAPNTYGADIGFLKLLTHLCCRECFRTPTSR